MKSKRLSRAHFEIVDAKTSPKLPAGVTPLSPVLRLLPHGRFQNPVLLLLPISTGEIGVEAVKAWRSKPHGEWELLTPEVIEEYERVRRVPAPEQVESADQSSSDDAPDDGKTYLLGFRLEHFSWMVAGVVHDETSASPPPPPWPPAEDVWPLVESASRFSCCLRISEAPFRTVIIRFQRKVRLPRLSLEPNRLAALSSPRGSGLWMCLQKASTPRPRTLPELLRVFGVCSS